jgi:N-acetylmuramic acid 6-phosphate etherase
MSFIRTTEQPSNYRHLEKMTVLELLTSINGEDKTVAFAVEKSITEIEQLVTAIVDKMLAGGRLFYIGAGTSGRLGIIDASECPPTYGVPEDLVVALMAGGDKAIRLSQEFAEDSTEQGWLDLQDHKVNKKDMVIGIAASGTTPYVNGALNHCRKHGILTGSICCNKGAPLSEEANFPVEIIVGPEFVTGSTRMKSGTAQKLVLNMISTSVMIQLGRVEDNQMVDMQLSNNKLIDRGIKMLMQELNIVDYAEAKKLLTKYKSVRMAIEGYHK